MIASGKVALLHPCRLLPGAKSCYLTHVGAPPLDSFSFGLEATRHIDIEFLLFMSGVTSKPFYTWLMASSDFPLSCVIFAFRELGIGVVPYSPLGRGFFAGRAAVESIPSGSLLVRKVKLVVYI